MQTFVVDNVKPDHSYKLVSGSAAEYWRSTLTRTSVKTWKEEPTGAKILGCSDGRYLQVGGNNNPLIKGVGLAYNRHYPLSLSPDAIWAVIAQGFSTWINENSEAVRKNFVSFEGKVSIEIEVPVYPNWTMVLSEFSERISDYVGKKRDLFVADFSTTTLDTRTASEVVLMYAMSKYFDYGMRTMCGFPRITLEGTVEDWEKIRDRVRTFGDFTSRASGPSKEHLTDWVGSLLPTLDAMVETSKGNIDLDFWRSFYNEGGGSGGPFVSGRVTTLFPYVRGAKGLVPKPKPGYGGGWTPDVFDRGMSKVDLKWNKLGEPLKVEFHGGLTGVTMAEDGTLRPETGWAIVDVTNVGS